MELKQYHDLFNDAWKHFRRYAEQIPLSDQAWENEVNDKVALVDKYPGCHRMAVKLMTQIEDELEHLDRGEP